MKLKRMFVAAVGVTVMALGSSSAFADVSLSSMKLVKLGDTRYWQVTAKCDRKGLTRKLRRKEGTKEWFSVDFPKQLDTNKIALARGVCDIDSDGNSTQQTATQVAPEPNKAESKVAPANAEAPAEAKTSDEREQLLEEQMKIEQKRIELQQKRLELQRKELQLKKRQAGV